MLRQKKTVESPSTTLMTESLPGQRKRRRRRRSTSAHGSARKALLLGEVLDSARFGD